MEGRKGVKLGGAGAILRGVGKRGVCSVRVCRWVAPRQGREGDRMCRMAEFCLCVRA